MIFERGVDERESVQRLFENLKEALPDLEALWETCNSHWGYEDPIYRFYHHSFKVYRLQSTTQEIVQALQDLYPEAELSSQFQQIIEEGTGISFKHEHNTRWAEVTRPILEAFFHARYFLDMAIRYGRDLEEPPLRLPSGWASFLYLYNLR